MQTRVLIVEDNKDLTENMSEYLEGYDYILDFAFNGLIALHLVSVNTYDVIVLDVMLPGMSGFLLCQRIRKELQCTTPIIFITAKDHIDEKVEGFSYGADDYLVKPFHLKELAIRIDALSRRGNPGIATLQAGSVSFEPGTLRIKVGGSEPVQLSGMSAHIMEALLRAYPHYLSYDDLSQKLWGEREVEAHTLRTHVYTLRKLLQDRFGNGLISTLHGRGYRLVPPGEN